VFYPSSDGKPMAENDIIRENLIEAIQGLGWWFRARADVYVSGNLLVYDVEGNPRKRVAPDVFVVVGVEKRLRENYKLWEEKVPPTCVIEIVSRTTWKDDVGSKMLRYQGWGVAEYYVFDPKDLYLVPPLQGYRLVKGQYVALEGPPFSSAVLGLEVHAQGDLLRFRERSTGIDLPTAREVHASLEAARQKAAAARQH